MANFLLSYASYILGVRFLFYMDQCIVFGGRLCTLDLYPRHEVVILGYGKNIFGTAGKISFFTKRCCQSGFVIRNISALKHNRAAHLS